MIVISNFEDMKREIAGMCRALQGLPEGIVFNSKLIAGELISNVLQHGDGRAFFSYERSVAEINICVRGENGYRPPEKSTLSDCYSDHGRGLFLIDALSERREYSEESGIRVVIAIKR